MPRTAKAYPAVVAAFLAASTLTACGGQATPSAAGGEQPDTVVTSRSEGKAVSNPRRGSFKKSDPNAPAGYMSPKDFHKTTPEPRSTYTQ